ncbi:hypothetical protein DSO57_1027980 [Entomophthora muscae]|uniref:Uncharacterized protein n=1 Tax=Entomophthora muscae TaxID=34485 RepID=A0ACC2RG93_9FUNG|nr:hypothetical protein DSO57_1027980 [Entomophthora muscae]
MIFASLATILGICACLSILSILFEATQYGFKARGCQNGFHVKGQASTKGCFIPKEIKLLKGQRWIQSNRNFTIFHQQPPSADTISGECRPTKPDGFFLDGFEAYYIATKTKYLALKQCPEKHYCIVKGLFFAGGIWRLTYELYATTNKHHQAKFKKSINDLKQSNLYHLVLQGPTSGTITFTPIHYRQKFNYKQYHFDVGLSRRKDHAITRSCTIVLKDRLIDGIFGFSPNS